MHAPTIEVRLLDELGDPGQVPRSQIREPRHQSVKRDACVPVPAWSGAPCA